MVRLLCCLKQLGYYIKLISSCQQLFKLFWKVFSNFLCSFWVTLIWYQNLQIMSIVFSMIFRNIWFCFSAFLGQWCYSTPYTLSCQPLFSFFNFFLGWKVYFHNPYAKVAFSLTHISTFTIVAFSSTIQIRQLPER